DRAALLCERLPARLLDHEQRLPLLRLIGSEQSPCRRRLHGHHADAVSDDVMQLAGDTRALVRDGRVRTLLPLAFGLSGTLLRLRGLPELATDREPDGPENGEGD